MKKLLAVLTLTVVAGCQEGISTPTSAITPSSPLAFVAVPRIDNPPPPPLDTGVAMDYGYATTRLHVTYFLNKPATNGWLTFQSDAAAGVASSSDGRISYHRGVFSGKGTLGVDTPNGLVLVDLASVSQSSSFSDCSKSCFSLSFDSATITDGEGTHKLEAVSFTPVRAVRGDFASGG